jgi:hypothetical protein
MNRDFDLDEVFGGLSTPVADRLKKTFQRAASAEPAPIPSEAQEAIGHVDLQSLALSVPGVFDEPSDTSSEFHRLHSAESIEKMHREAVTHERHREPQRIEKFVRGSATELKKFSLLDYLKRTKLKGAELRALIAGCDRSVQSELLEIAESEGMI